MILSDREIKLALERGTIKVGPLPEFLSFGVKPWTSTALDLRLDAEISRWKEPEGHGLEMVFDPTLKGFDSTKLAAQYCSLESCKDAGVVIHPKELLLGWTIEKVRLSSDSRICARVEGKSSLARLGLGIHVTAPTIHAGFGDSQPENPTFEGIPIRLEIWNAGPLKIRLRQGMSICQLIFEEVHGMPMAGYGGQFKDQGPK